MIKVCAIYEMSIKELIRAADFDYKIKTSHVTNKTYSKEYLSKSTMNTILFTTTI